MEYTIKVTYGSGDTFTTRSGLKTHVGAIWEDIEEAREAMKCIEEHYKANTDYNIYNYKNSAWYCEDYPVVCLLVPINKQWKRISASAWCGYFETLEEIEVVPYFGEKNLNKIKIR